jgi:hypothetical protein
VESISSPISCDSLLVPRATSSAQMASATDDSIELDLADNEPEWLVEESIYGPPCRNPAHHLYSCPLLPFDNVLYSNQTALGHSGGQILAGVEKHTKTHEEVVSCPCVQCCPCNLHANWRKVAAEKLAQKSDCKTLDEQCQQLPTKRRRAATKLAPSVKEERAASVSRSTTRPLLVDGKPPELLAEYDVHQEIGSGQPLTAESHIKLCGTMLIHVVLV